MTEGAPLERAEKLFNLAERAYDLWGRILDAQLEYICEYPYELPKKDENLRTYNDQASLARHLFDTAIVRANIPVPDTDLASYDEPKQPAPRPAEPIQRYRATTRSQEETADYTDSILEKARKELDKIHEDYIPARSEEANKRQFLSGDTGVYVKKGDEQVNKKVPNRHISEQEDLTQVVLWAAQANGPKQAPFLQTSADRIGFVIEMINMSRLDEAIHMQIEEMWELLDEAVEEGLLTGTDDPKITAKGFGLVQEVAKNSRTKVQPRF